ncbi:MAG: hypothetical protein HY290_16770 [Planctomycetia bacterium]|nr:hypothetical protein [Planctomycetia bacterium]
MRRAIKLEPRNPERAQKRRFGDGYSSKSPLSTLAARLTSAFEVQTPRFVNNAFSAVNYPQPYSQQLVASQNNKNRARRCVATQTASLTQVAACSADAERSPAMKNAQFTGRYSLYEYSEPVSDPAPGSRA